jgi:hypothetical protein
MTGIYKITNLLNGKCYVGSSIEIGRRWKQHIGMCLSTSRYSQYPLYRAFMKYGTDNFDFEVLEECEPEELINKERYYYNLLRPEYNCIYPNENPILSPVVRARHPGKCKAAWKYRSEESKAKAFENIKKGSGSAGSNKFKGVKIQAIELETGNVTFFNSLYEAEKTLSIPRQSISQILNENHARKQAKGYRFERCV